MERRRASASSRRLEEFSHLHYDSESDSSSYRSPQTMLEIIASRIPNSWAAFSLYVDFSIVNELMGEESSEEEIAEPDLDALVQEYRRRKEQ